MRIVLVLSALFGLAASVDAQDALPILPDLTKSPGAINPNLTQEIICDANFSTKQFRKSSKSDRKCVLARYGGPPSYAFTYDHIIPLEIGGFDSCDNLWPEPRAEARFKDKVEDAMRARVCVCHDLTLAQAQEMIRSNWRLAFARYVTPKGSKICDVNPLPTME